MKCFRRNYHKPSREYGSHGEGEQFKPVWGYMVPHEKDKPGAVSPDGKWSEYKYGESVATLLGLPWETRDEGGVYGAAKRLVGRDCNCIFEDHKNAYTRTAGYGYELLILKGDNLSRRYAELILEEFERRYPARKNRGIKEMAKGGRGYQNLLNHKKAGAEVAILGEMFFIDKSREFIPPAEYVNFLKEVLV